jgi:hypothetical protein
MEEVAISFGILGFDFSAIPKTSGAQGVEDPEVVKRDVPWRRRFGDFRVRQFDRFKDKRSGHFSVGIPEVPKVTYLGVGLW